MEYTLFWNKVYTHMCRQKQTYRQSTSYNSFLFTSLLLLVGVLKEGFSKHCDFIVINFSSIKSGLSCNDFCLSTTFCKTACCCCNKLTMSGFESWHISDAKQPNCLYVGQPRSCSGTAGTLTSPKLKLSDALSSSLSLSAR